MPAQGVAVVIPAKDEARRIGATVRAAATIPAVELVVVVDDGSNEDTAIRAEEAGAVVVRHPRNLGKGAAMESGAAMVATIEGREGRTAPMVLLFLDADLEDTAAAGSALAAPVLNGGVEMTIATLPTQATAGGGHGFVVRLARQGIARATGWTPTQPLSGQRCVTRAAFEAALPLATGFGVEVGLTIDLLRRGYVVREVPVPFHHRVTGADWRAQVHRGRQWLHVARALVSRGVWPQLRGR